MTLPVRMWSDPQLRQKVDNEPFIACSVPILGPTMVKLLSDKSNSGHNIIVKHCISRLFQMSLEIPVKIIDASHRR